MVKKPNKSSSAFPGGDGSPGSLGPRAGSEVPTASKDGGGLVAHGASSRWARGPGELPVGGSSYLHSRVDRGAGGWDFDRRVEGTAYRVRWRDRGIAVEKGGCSGGGLVW